MAKSDGADRGRKVKVMFYSPLSLRYGGGFEHNILQTVKHLEKYDVSSLLVCAKSVANDRDRMSIQRIKIILDKVSAKYFEFVCLPFPTTSFGSPVPLLHDFKKIAKAVRDCDIIYFNNAHAFQDLLVYSLKKIYKKPVISGQHCKLYYFSTFWDKTHNLYVNSLGKNLLRKFDAYRVLNSQHFHLFNSWGLKNTYLIPQGVDTEKFKPNNFEKNTKKFQVLYVGRLSPEKGIDILCESIKAINNSLQKNIEFIIVGSGPLEFLVQRLAERYENVSYLGHLEDILPKIYRSCDLFVMPSRGEALGTVALEAQASGLPVIAFDCMGPRDTLINGITGSLIRKEDAKMLTQKIVEYYSLWLNNYEKYKQMRLAARENAVKRFDWNIIAEHIYDMLRETLARAKNEDTF